MTGFHPFRSAAILRADFHIYFSLLIFADAALALFCDLTMGSALKYVAEIFSSLERRLPILYSMHLCSPLKIETIEKHPICRGERVETLLCNILILKDCIRRACLKIVPNTGL